MIGRQMKYKSSNCATSKPASPSRACDAAESHATQSSSICGRSWLSLEVSARQIDALLWSEKQHSTLSTYPDIKVVVRSA
jgi:hypothetical protein